MSESELASLEREISALLDQLDRLYEEAEATIAAITDPEEAFKRATEFVDKAHGFHNEVAGRFGKLRARQAVRIKQKESLSLAGLADRISVSKARADQFVRHAKEELP